MKPPATGERGATMCTRIQRDYGPVSVAPNRSLRRASSLRRRPLVFETAQDQLAAGALAFTPSPNYVYALSSVTWQTAVGNMTRVFVGIGSNVAPERHIGQAYALLRNAFDGVAFSNAYRNPADGFDGEDFVNAVAAFDTAAALPTILATLRRIELDVGKDLSEPRFAPKTIDLDLLFYGMTRIDNDRLTLPRRNALTKAYYLRPLAEIAPEWRDPSTGASVGDLWRQFESSEPQPFDIVTIRPLHTTSARASLRVDDLEIAVHLGVPDAERASAQTIRVSFEIVFPTVPTAAADDDIHGTIDYGIVSHELIEVARERPYRTIEHLGETCFGKVLCHLTAPGTRLRLNVRKFPPIDGLKGGAAFELEGVR